MSRDLVFDVAMAARIKGEFGSKGTNWTEEDLRRLCEGGVIPQLWKVLNGKAKIIECDDTLIDCDAEPVIPSWYAVEKHEKGGQLIWDPKKVGVHIIQPAKGKSITFGEILPLELANKPVLNVNVRDYLIHRKYLIPNEWKGLTVVFPGTILRCEQNRFCVPGLYCDAYMGEYGAHVWWVDTEVRFCWDANDSRRKYAIAIHR